jgi:hypothetical protein
MQLPNWPNALLAESKTIQRPNRKYLPLARKADSFLEEYNDLSQLSCTNNLE